MKIPFLTETCEPMFDLQPLPGLNKSCEPEEAKAHIRIHTEAANSNPRNCSEYHERVGKLWEKYYSKALERYE